MKKISTIIIVAVLWSIVHGASWVNGGSYQYTTDPISVGKTSSPAAEVEIVSDGAALTVEGHPIRHGATATFGAGNNSEGYALSVNAESTVVDGAAKIATYGTSPALILHCSPEANNAKALIIKDHFHSTTHFTPRVGIGTESPSCVLDVKAYRHNSNGIIKAVYQASDADYIDMPAIVGTSQHKPGSSSGDNWGYGGYFTGGYMGARCIGESLDDHNAYMRYGIYAEANDATKKYAGYFNGDLLYTGELRDVSDKKFKQDIESLSGAMDKIMQLKPVTYHFDTASFPEMNFPSKKSMGLIAQDVEKVIPEIVQKDVHPIIERRTDPRSNETEHSTFKSVNYISLIPVLIAAAQEQQKTISKLQKEVNGLREELKYR